MGTGRAIMKCKNEDKKEVDENCCWKYKQIVVAFYRPSGNNNRDHQYVLNVFKPIKHIEKIH